MYWKDIFWKLVEVLNVLMLCRFWEPRRLFPAFFKIYKIFFKIYKNGPDRSGPFRTVPDRSGPFRTVTGHFASIKQPLRTVTDRYGPLRTVTDRYEPLRTVTDRYGPLRVISYVHRILYELTEKCADARGSWRFRDFFQIFWAGHWENPQKICEKSKSAGVSAFFCDFIKNAATLADLDDFAIFL